MKNIFRLSKPAILTAFLAISAVPFASAAPAAAFAQSSLHSSAHVKHFTSSAVPVCHAAECAFALHVNPGLLPGKPFACPAIRNAGGLITITNRFVTGDQNDTMKVIAYGLPPNTGFDLFTVQNSPLDGPNPFGVGWYQSDVESNSAGVAEVTVQGIFDKETFVENPGDPFNPIHTFNVGFWFDSPTAEQQACGNATAPPKTPFNGEQNAGLLAMITQGAPLNAVR
jgi:hypothetical protein